MYHFSYEWWNAEQNKSDEVFYDNKTDSLFEPSSKEFVDCLAPGLCYRQRTNITNMTV